MLNTSRHKPIAYKHDFLTKSDQIIKNKNIESTLLFWSNSQRDVVITCDLILEMCFDRHKEPKSTSDFTQTTQNQGGDFVCVYMSDYVFLVREWEMEVMNE